MPIMPVLAISSRSRMELSLADAPVSSRKVASLTRYIVAPVILSVT